MSPRYQSPPNWPPPPPGWTPPPGWAPDPSWGPAPPGWQFWASEAPAGRPNRSAWGWALLSALVWWLLHIGFLSAVTEVFNAEVAGRLFASYLLGGLATAAAAFLMRARWPRWVYPLAVLPPIFFFLVLNTLGQQAG